MGEQLPSMPTPEMEQNNTICELLHTIFKSGIADKDDERVLRQHSLACDRCCGLLFEIFGLKNTIDGELE
jgi:hypothetical protein